MSKLIFFILIFFAGQQSTYWTKNRDASGYLRIGRSRKNQYFIQVEGE